MSDTEYDDNQYPWVRCKSCNNFAPYDIDEVICDYCHVNKIIINIIKNNNFNIFNNNKLRKEIIKDNRFKINLLSNLYVLYYITKEISYEDLEKSINICFNDYDWTVTSLEIMYNISKNNKLMNSNMIFSIKNNIKEKYINTFINKLERIVDKINEKIDNYEENRKIGCIMCEKYFLSLNKKQITCGNCYFSKEDMINICLL